MGWYAPELFTFCSFLVYFLISLRKGTRRYVRFLAQVLSFLGLIIAGASILEEGEFFAGAYRVDLFSQVFKLLLALGLFLVFAMGRRSPEEVEEGYLPEFYMFLTLGTLGLMMLVSSVDLISLFIALELSSYSIYVIVPLRRGHGAVDLEAAAKYVFFGAIASGVMLYGMGYLYALTGSTNLHHVLGGLREVALEPMGVMALVLTLVGFFFKLSLFPLHFWAPDIYEGSSHLTTTYIATVPKVGAVALLLRLAFLAPQEAKAFVEVLVVLSALSMTLGNLVGLVQRDLKRLLAYSGIAHAGYVMLGVLALSGEGGASATYYMAVYLLMNLGLFLVVVILSRRGENVLIEDLKGLYRRAPLLAFTLAVSAFSLAGIPPTGGFIGKLLLFTAAFKAGHLVLVIVATVNTAISLFYYLNLVRYSYSREPEGTSEGVALSWGERVLCYLYIVLIIYTGLFPGPLMKIFEAASLAL